MGLYTSPHLVSVRERVVVNGEPMSEAAFAEWTAILEPHIERTEASFFEAMTAIGFADLASRDVDIAVIEVGLGGRLDSTNVITTPPGIHVGDNNNVRDNGDDFNLYNGNTNLVDRIHFGMQLIDIALLSNGMLKGQSLSNFIKRSVELL